MSTLPADAVARFRGLLGAKLVRICTDTRVDTGLLADSDLVMVLFATHAIDYVSLIDKFIIIHISYNYVFTISRRKICTNIHMLYFAYAVRPNWVDATLKAAKTPHVYVANSHKIGKITYFLVSERRKRVKLL